MLKNISNLGKKLSNNQLKKIQGGKYNAPVCAFNSDCDPYENGQLCCSWTTNQCVAAGSSQCVSL